MVRLMFVLWTAILLPETTCRGAETDPPPLRVMSFNVRYGTAPDGENHWERRRELCAARIAAFDPDLVGLQEALAFQNAFLVEKLEGYGQLGVGRDDGRERGEFSTILYRKRRLEPLASGTFWLSETPEVPGSKSWDSALPRIATWARFRDRMDGGRELLAVNTHFDHRGVQARLQAARILRRFITEQAAGGPAVLLGDFNAAPGSEPYRALTGPEAGQVELRDTYAVRSAPETGTYHGFGETARSARIDWILCTPHFEVLDAQIDRYHEGPLYPSDHYPVTAVIVRRPASP